MENTKRRGSGKYRVAGLVLTALVLSACSQQDAKTEDERNPGIANIETESSYEEPESREASVDDDFQAYGAEQSAQNNMTASTSDASDEISGGSQTGQDNPAESTPVTNGLSQPAYIGDWKVVDYCYPQAPCGLSQEEVDDLIGSELTYAVDSFRFNHKVIQSEVFGYEFSFYDSLEEYNQSYNVSVDSWFADGDMGMVKCGYLALEEDIFGNCFTWMEEQPDKMLINYYGVIFLAVNEEPQVGPAIGSSRDKAYLEALGDLLFYNQLPIGQEAEDISVTVHFAIQDIDGDGRDELLIDYQGSMMATIQEMVYDYDESKKELYREIRDFPDILFYANGFARADWSHNHTRSDFWPYNLYWYDSGADQYELAYVVTAWDKELSETDSEGNSFPNEADISGTGRVYLIEDQRTGEVLKPMDVTEYDKWYADLMGESAPEEITIGWQLLDEVNLNHLQSRKSSGV